MGIDIFDSFDIFIDFDEFLPFGGAARGKSIGDERGWFPDVEYVVD